jgi:hypothetical protein
VKPLGIDGPSPGNSPAVADPNSGGLVPAFSEAGTWADETDIRPTMLYLAGIVDDYIMDGRVLTDILVHPGSAKVLEDLGHCYKQLNASVGMFGTDTLIASTAALASGSSSNDSKYTQIDSNLSSLATQRDPLATKIKNTLNQVEFHGATPTKAEIAQQQQGCNDLLTSASNLAAQS